MSICRKIKPQFLPSLFFVFYFLPTLTMALEINSSSEANLCIQELSAEEQEAIYSRIVNVGASFSKGCFTCDFNKDTRDYLKSIGEYGWVNRHFLIKLLKETDWKDPARFSGNVISIIENDPRHDGTKLIDRVDETNPYLNAWKLNYEASHLRPYEENEVRELLNKNSFKADSSIIGGLRLAKSVGRHEAHEYGGHLYHLGESQTYSPNHREKSIFDFSVDGTRSSEIFAFLANEDLYNELVNSGWKDQQKRDYLIKIVGEKIARTNPSLIVAGDALFWDAVPRLLARIHKTKGISWITKILTNRIIREKLLGKVVYPIDQEERMISDFLRLMSNLSTGKYGNKPVPVIIARLIHDLGFEFENPVFAKDFGLFVATLMKNLLGIDLESDIVDALRNFKKSDYEELYQDEKLSDYMEGHDPGVEAAGFKNWLLRRILKQVVKDLPLVVMALERSFNETNMILKKFVDENETNFRVLEVDDFYRSIPYSVSPVTIHPSSYGSMIMAGVLKDSLCD